MITAGIVSLLFKLLKQPVVLGYIVAGILVGPHLFGENLVNPENVEAWGNIGVLFVLFGDVFVFLAIVALVVKLVRRARSR